MPFRSFQWWLLIFFQCFMYYMMRFICPFPPSFLSILALTWFPRADFMYGKASLRLVLWLSHVAQFVLLVLSENSWGDAVFFSIWAATDCQATRDHGKALSPFDFAYGREGGGCSWCIEVTLTLTGVMMPACMLLGYFFAFVLRRKNYFWNPRINLLWSFKGILPF